MILGFQIAAAVVILIGLISLGLARNAEWARFGFALVIIGAGFAVGALIARWLD